MTNPQGTPIWYELMTDAPDAAQEFYAGVMGWTFQSPPGGMERDYRTFTATDDEAVGGVMHIPDGAPFGPTWAVYFGVDDVDATVEKLKLLGGSVYMEPQDIPDVGRFAFVSDPQGASFYVMRGDSDEESTAFEPSAPGHCSWNELVTSDQAAALEFYGALFGWEKSGAMPIGDNGDYSFIRCGDADIGAMMDRPDEHKNSQPFWNFAFQVADIDAAKAAAESGGATVTYGPIKLPDENWLIQVDDPQGARVMFTGARTEKKT